MIQDIVFFKLPGIMDEIIIYGKVSDKDVGSFHNTFQIDRFMVVCAGINFLWVHGFSLLFIGHQRVAASLFPTSNARFNDQGPPLPVRQYGLYGGIQGIDDLCLNEWVLSGLRLSYSRWNPDSPGRVHCEHTTAARHSRCGLRHDRNSVARRAAGCRYRSVFSFMIQWSHMCKVNVKIGAVIVSSPR